MKYWKEIAIFFIGVSTALIAVLKFEKPQSVTNIENTTKIKRNLAPVTATNDVEVVKEPQTKKERKGLFKKLFKRKNIIN